MISLTGLFYRAVLILLGVWTALFVSGCSKRLEEPGRTPERQKMDLFAEAETLLLKGDKEQAALSYNRYVEENPTGSKAARALHFMGEWASEKGDERGALAYYQKAAIADDKYEGLPEIRFETARLLALIGEIEASTAKAETWLSLYPDHPRRSEMFILLGDNYLSLNRRREAFGCFAKAFSESEGKGPSGTEVSKRLQRQLDTANPEELWWMADLVSDTPFGAAAYKRLFRFLVKEGDTHRAGDVLAKLKEQKSFALPGPEIESLQAELFELTGVRKGVLGCILPLSGSFAQYGYEVLKGVQLAMESQPVRECKYPLELAIRDTASEENRLIEAIGELADKEKVMAVFGLFSRKEALTAAEKSNSLGLPLIAITQKEGITSVGETVFRLFPTAEQELDAILSWAVDVLGVSRFGVLFPENPYGKVLTSMFIKAVESRGASVTAAESYKEGETDFEGPIKRLTEKSHAPASSLKEELSEARGEEEQVLIRGVKTKPRTDFEALFIPDSADRIEMIAPQLVYYDILQPILLGTSLWHNKKLIDEAGAYLSSAYVPASYYEDVENALSGNFNSAFIAAYGSDPVLLSALGYDAVRIASTIACSDGVRTRRDFAGLLKSLRDFETLRGPATTDARRQIPNCTPSLGLIPFSCHLGDYDSDLKEYYQGDSHEELSENIRRG